MKMADKFQ